MSLYIRRFCPHCRQDFGMQRYVDALGCPVKTCLTCRKPFRDRWYREWTMFSIKDKLIQVFALFVYGPALAALGFAVVAGLTAGYFFGPQVRDTVAEVAAWAGAVLFATNSVRKIVASIRRTRDPQYLQSLDKMAAL